MILRFLFAALVVPTASWCARAETVPLGVVFKGEQTLLELTYINKGKTAVHIAQVSPSCDCIEMLQPPGDVPVGGDIKIPLVHHAENAGAVDVTVRLMGDKPSAVIKTYTVAGFVAERSWFLLPREAQAKGLTFIDTRAPSQFYRLHIAHALNIPAFAIKTRSDLRGRKLVLVDNGFSPADLLTQVDVLRGQGFGQVFVLQGGLPAWVRAGGKVEGSFQSVLEVARISAADFSWARRLAKWRLVIVGDVSIPMAEAQDAAKLGPTDKIDDVLVALSKDETQGLPSNILVIAPSNDGDARIEAQLGRAKSWPVFYLKGGVSALTAFYREQIAAARHTDKLFKTSVARNTPVIAGGCSSCRH